MTESVVDLVQHQHRVGPFDSLIDHVTLYRTMTESVGDLVQHQHIVGPFALLIDSRIDSLFDSRDPI